MAKKARIHKQNGQSFECPVHAVKNFRRLIGEQIARVEIISDEPVEAAPSVEPVEETVITHPEAAPGTPAEEKKEETDGDKPNVRWTKKQLQDYLRENHPEIEFQSNDTKTMLLNFIKAATK